MKETFAQYKARLFGYVGQRDPMAILRQTPSILQRLVARQSPRRLRRQPKPGKWSVAEILAHMADVEIVLAYRVRRVLAQPRAPIEAFDQDVWAAALRYRGIDPAKSLARQRELRRWNIDLLGRLTAEEWSRFGNHSERGRESVRDMVKLLAGHDRNHTGQVRAVLSSGVRKKPRRRAAS